MQMRNRLPHPYTLEYANEFIQFVKDLPKGTVKGIMHNGELVGTLGIFPQDDVYQKSAELGYLIGEDYWGKGIGTQAIKMICDWAFAECDINRIFASVFETNPASMKVLLKNGFIQEGILKKAIYKDGVFLDEHRFAMLKT